MPSSKPRLATYTTKEIIDKFQYIADYERRSSSKELEFIVLNYIKNFEDNNGKLIVGEDGKIKIAKPTVICKDKLSNSKTG